MIQFKIPHEVLNKIVEYINDNESLNLFYTCKFIYNTLKHNGFKKSLSITPSNIINSNNIIESHYRTLNCLVYVDIQNQSQLSLNHWFENMIFLRCRLPDLYPNKMTNTKLLVIHSLKYNMLNIKWDFFPKLEDLYIRAYDITNLDYDKCKNLKKVCIYIFNDDSKFFNTTLN